MRGRNQLSKLGESALDILSGCRGTAPVGGILSRWGRLQRLGPGWMTAIDLLRLSEAVIEVGRAIGGSIGNSIGNPIGTFDGACSLPPFSDETVRHWFR